MKIHRLMREYAAAAVLIVFCFCARAEGQQETPAPVSFEEKLLATIPPDTEIVSLNDQRALLILDGGRNVVYGVRPAGKDPAVESEHQVLLGNAAIDRFQTLFPYVWSWGAGPFFMQAGDPKTFGVRGKKKDGWYILTSSGSFGPYGRVSMPQFSREGSRWAFRARVGEDWFAVIDGKRQESFPWVGLPQFSPDGKSIRYVAYKGPDVPAVKSVVPDDDSTPGIGGEWYLLGDGKPFGPEQGIGTVRFSPDGRLYWLRTTKSGTSVVGPGGEKGPFRGWANLQFTGSGKLVLQASDNGKYIVQVGDESPQTFDCVRQALVSPASEVVAVPVNEGGKSAQWFRCTGGKWRINVNGVLGKLFDDIGRPVLSGDGRHVAYTAEVDGKRFVVLDGNVFGPAGTGFNVQQIKLSKNGKAVAWIEFSLEERKLLVNGQALQLPCKTVKSLTISSDGSSVASIGSNFGDDLVMLGTKEVAACKEVKELLFSPSGQHLAYVGRKDGQLMVGADGKWLFPCSEVLSPIHFSPDEKKIALGIRRNQEILWKVAVLE
jgi:hypothetical protein